MFVRIRRRAPPGPTRHLAALVQEVDGHKLPVLGQYLERSASEAVQRRANRKRRFECRLKFRAKFARERASRESAKAGRHARSANDPIQFGGGAGRRPAPPLGRPRRRDPWRGAPRRRRALLDDGPRERDALRHAANLARPHRARRHHQRHGQSRHHRAGRHLCLRRHRGALLRLQTKVKKGQICAKIDPRPYQVVVDQDRANLGVARAQLVKDQANLVYAKLAYERNKRLAATKAVSQDVLDASKNALDQATAQIGLDQATIALQRGAAARRRDQSRLHRHHFAGRRHRRHSRSVEMGQTVAASFQTPTLSWSPPI